MDPTWHAGVPHPHASTCPKPRMPVVPVRCSVIGEGRCGRNFVHWHPPPTPSHEFSLRKPPGRVANNAAHVRGSSTRASPLHCQDGALLPSRRKAASEYLYKVQPACYAAGAPVGEHRSCAGRGPNRIWQPNDTCAKPVVVATLHRYRQLCRDTPLATFVLFVPSRRRRNQVKFTTCNKLPCRRRRLSDAGAGGLDVSSPCPCAVCPPPHECLAGTVGMLDPAKELGALRVVWISCPGDVSHVLPSAGGPHSASMWRPLGTSTRKSAKVTLAMKAVHVDRKTSRSWATLVCHGSSVVSLTVA